VSEKNKKWDYKKAGVDTEKAGRYIRNLKSVIQETQTKASGGSVVDNYGGFAGIFQPNQSFHGTNLVAATDGVGTKIELARKFNYLGGLGTDLVGMCVNDLYCVGANPLFFLDYISCGKLGDAWYNPVIESIAAACIETSMALLGGETAEHPGVMKDDDFDLAGFCVGSVVPDQHLPKKSEIKEGQQVYGFASSGLHSNGFSLVRKILKQLETDDNTRYNKLISDENWIKNTLLCPTKLYTFLPDLIKESQILAAAHITGGGYYENLERVLPESCSMVIENPCIAEFEIFSFLKEFVNEQDLYKTFNMGTGIAVVAPESSKKSIEKFGGVYMGRIVNRKEESVIIEGV